MGWLMSYCWGVVGQVQGHTTPCSASITTPAPASEYSDGQVQVTPGPEPTASVPEAQETTTASGPAVVPTGVPSENGAGGARGWVGGAAVVVGLGIGGVVWF